MPPTAKPRKRQTTLAKEIEKYEREQEQRRVRKELTNVAEHADRELKEQFPDLSDVGKRYWALAQSFYITLALSVKGPSRPFEATEAASKTLMSEYKLPELAQAKDELALLDVSMVQQLSTSWWIIVGQRAAEAAKNHDADDPVADSETEADDPVADSETEADDPVADSETEADDPTVNVDEEQEE